MNRSVRQLCIAVLIFAISASAQFLTSTTNVAAQKRDSFAVRGDEPPPGANSGTTGLFTITGAGAPTEYGDYVSASAALNTTYSLYVEVPPGTSNLTIDIFDADIGAGGAADASGGRDRNRGGYNSTVNYSLRDPSGVVQAVNFTTGNTTLPAGADNAWLTLFSTGSPAVGHWEVRVDMSAAVTAGDDINAVGIRAHDGTAGPGGTELNIYMDGMTALGVNAPTSGTQSRSYTLYPYITSGCTFSKNDFDYDSNSGDTGSMTFTSRSGVFSQTFTSTSLSGNDVWVRNNITAWTSDTSATDYGIWSSNITVSSYLVAGTPNGNYVDIYLGSYAAAANPPGSNPMPNSFRLYVATDASAVPVKPHLLHHYGQLSGPNPLGVGQTGTMRIRVAFVNPAPFPVTFSAINTVTANVSGAGAVYAGGAAVTQGSLVSQPSIGGTGNVVWNPGVVPASTVAQLFYNVNVTPSSAGQRIPITATPASGNGTTARFVDETGNTTQARATLTFGPLCELAVTQGIISPAPTAATVSLSGRVTDVDGFAVRNAVVNLTGTNGQTRTLRTGTFGNFRFDEVTAGESYVLTAVSKYYEYEPMVVVAYDTLEDLELTPVNGSK
jgi:hypothetical protein